MAARAHRAGKRKMGYFRGVAHVFSSFRASSAQEMFQFPLFLMLVCVIFLSQRNKYSSRYGTFEQHVQPIRLGG